MFSLVCENRKPHVLRELKFREALLTWIYTSRFFVRSHLPRTFAQPLFECRVASRTYLQSSFLHPTKHASTDVSALKTSTYIQR